MQMSNPSLPSTIDVSKLSPEAQAIIASLQAQIAAKAVNTGSTIKIAKSGGVSLYGLGRWPVTLYKSQWMSLISRVEEVKAFLAANDSLLAEKPQKE